MLPVPFNSNELTKTLANRVLFFSDEDPRDYVHGLGAVTKFSFDASGTINMEKMPKSDPSMIYTTLAVHIHGKPAEPLPYWPSYATLSAEQRWSYLNWLTDISQPIEMGYVFLYYYGLERHLLIGDFEAAFSEVISLRSWHKNKSFLTYSENSLLNAIIIRNRPDMLSSLAVSDEMNKFSEFQLEIALANGLSLSPANFIEVLFGFSRISKTAIKKNLPLYENCVEEVFQIEYSITGFPVKKYVNLPDIPMMRKPAFSNYSFPDNVRFANVHDFYAFEPLFTEVKRVHHLSYELFKKRNKKS